MKKINLLILICLLLSNCWIKAEQKLPTSAEEKTLANELLQKLYALGSFQAVYQATSQAKPAGKVTILLNNRQKYCLIRAVFNGTNATDACMVLDFSKSSDKICNIKMLTISGKKGKKFQWSSRDMFNHLDNPVGVVSCVTRQLQLETKTSAGINGTLKAANPTLSLGLDPSNIVFGAGFGCTSTNLSVSWLDPDTITNAISIVETPESVQFSYPDNQLVTVDTATGLLLKDSMPDPAKPGLRELVLQNHSPLSDTMPYSSIIPEYKTIKFDEPSPNPLADQMSTSYLTSLGSQFSAITNFDEILQTNSTGITMAAREAGRQMVREEVKTSFDKNSITKFRDLSLVPAYENYLQNPPMDVKDLSFTNLLISTMAMAETNLNISTTPEALEHIQKIKNNSYGIIGKLPKNAQPPLVKICDIALPALAQGAMMEYFKIVLAKVMTMKQLNFNSDEAYAYYKRGCWEQQSGDLASALEDYNKAIELSPNFALPYYNRGWLKRGKGDLDGAIADYNRAIKIKHDYFYAYDNRGLTKEDKGDLSGAMKDYNKAIALDSNFADAYKNRGLLKQIKGDLNGAIIDFKKAFEFKPDDADIRKKLIEIQAQMKESASP